jgi:hypothetical protein
MRLLHARASRGLAASHVCFPEAACTPATRRIDLCHELFAN